MKVCDRIDEELNKSVYLEGIERSGTILGSLLELISEISSDINVGIKDNFDKVCKIRGILKPIYNLESNNAIKFIVKDKLGRRADYEKRR